jgi:hypothetical protein
MTGYMVTRLYTEMTLKRGTVAPAPRTAIELHNAPCKHSSGAERCSLSAGASPSRRVHAARCFTTLFAATLHFVLPCSCCKRRDRCTFALHQLALLPLGPLQSEGWTLAAHLCCCAGAAQLQACDHDRASRDGFKVPSSACRQAAERR